MEKDNDHQFYQVTPRQGQPHIHHIEYRQGLNRIDVSVHGPVPAIPRESLFDRANVLVKIHPFPETHIDNTTSHLPSTKRIIAKTQSLLTDCIIVSSLPGTTFEFTISVITYDLSIFSSIVNGCVLLLLSAGVPMRYTPCSTTSILNSTPHTSHNLPSPFIFHPSDQSVIKPFSLFVVTHTSTNFDEIVMLDMFGDPPRSPTVISDLSKASRPEAERFCLFCRSFVSTLQK
ncbi:hypothetical protein BLNAU_3800 [Blattamonas nauphoetae]|uniref:Uncharacterized protein n=1 Tax=Blattamonas nauphoetae TaxID=2049346 RepID=A0ABQ9YCM9_9EUKA|nr:hypothetical protein BLNAU_3800 [Blattamonas nauphoetae]